MPNPEHPAAEVVEQRCDERPRRGWSWITSVLSVVVAFGSACGQSARPVAEPSAPPAPLVSPSAGSARSEPPAEPETRVRPVEPETKDRAEAPSPVCRLLACSNRLILFGDAPGGFRGDLELEVCVHDRCESQVLNLPRVKKEGQVRGEDRLLLVVSPPQHCPLVLLEDCAGSTLEERISTQRQGESLLAFVIDAEATGREPMRLRVALTKDSKEKVLLDGPVDFATDSSCSRPNGSNCEPECCTALREF